MSIFDCIGISFALMAIVGLIVLVIRSILDDRLIFFVIKTLVTMIMNGIFIFLILNIITKGV